MAFHNDHNINFMINIYSDSNQIALYFLYQNIVNLDNMVIMTGNFNIRDSNWDSYVYHYSIHTDDLITIIDSLGLEFSSSSNPGPTGFMNNPQDSNSGIDLIFLPPNNSGFGKHYKKAKLQARIKLTALCSAINKENSIEFPLDFLYYLYNYYMVYTLLSHAYHMTHHVMSCDMML